MLYLNESILYTEADTIVYPFVPGSEIPKGSLHEAVAVVVGGDYLEKYRTAVRMQKFHPGGVWVHYVRDGEWAGRWVIGIPMFTEMKFVDLRRSIVAAVMAFGKLASDAMAVQIPMIPCAWGEELQEAVWMYMEELIRRGAEMQKDRTISQEIWLYTEEYEDRSGAEHGVRSDEQRLIDEYLREAGEKVGTP